MTRQWGRRVRGPTNDFHASGQPRDLKAMREMESKAENATQARDAAVSELDQMFQPLMGDAEAPVKSQP